jgi:hypothetical protein
VAWGPEWGDAGQADVADEEGVVAEADEDGEDMPRVTMQTMRLWRRSLLMKT